MITFNEAKSIIEKEYSDSRILSAMEIPTGYIFSIKPKSWGDDKYVLDGFFKVSNKDGSISEYSPIMDLEEFKKAQSNIIYRG